MTTLPQDPPSLDMDAVDDTVLEAMSEADFDALPFGVIKLDEAGRIALYNEAEAVIARRSRDSVLGRRFFEDIAPCTNVQRFRGRLDEMVARGERTRTFDFEFRFPWGDRSVRIRLWIGADRGRWVFVSPI